MENEHRHFWGWLWGEQLIFLGGVKPCFVWVSTSGFCCCPKCRVIKAVPLLIHVSTGWAIILLWPGIFLYFPQKNTQHQPPKSNKMESWSNAIFGLFGWMCCHLTYLKTYPPVNKHSNGKSPCSIGNTSSKGGFPIAMLDYRRVDVQRCFMSKGIRPSPSLSPTSPGVKRQMTSVGPRPGPRMFAEEKKGQKSTQNQGK